MFKKKELWNYSLTAGEEYVWLDVSGIGCVTRVVAWKPNDGVDMLKVYWYVILDYGQPDPEQVRPSNIDYWGLGSEGVHNLGSGCLIVRHFDTSTGWFEAALLCNPLSWSFRSSLQAKVYNSTSEDTTVLHRVCYMLFTASTTIQLIADERVNADDLRKYINFEYARQLVSSATYHALPLTAEHIEAAKLVVEGKAPPEPYTDLTREEAELWLKLGEGKHHLVELTVDERRFKNMSEFFNFLNWLEKEFNMKVLDYSMDILQLL